MIGRDGARGCARGDDRETRGWSDGTARETVRDRIAAIRPHDGREGHARTDALSWVDSGAPLFRVKAPDLPARHLVAYVVLVDERIGWVLLVRHLKAGRWLPAGGHVDVGEDPRVTASRELTEELGVRGRPHPDIGAEPFFVSLNQIRGPASHLDLRLWFVAELTRGTRG